MIKYYRWKNCFRATSGNIILRYSIGLEKILFTDYLPENYYTCLSVDIPEDIRKKFEDVFNDPLTEIEYEKWLCKK